MESVVHYEPGNGILRVGLPCTRPEPCGVVRVSGTLGVVQWRTRSVEVLASERGRRGAAEAS
jgi:hypothetical protein